MKNLGVIAAFVLAGIHAPASASSDITFVDHLIVVTSDEAIHFGDGGRFYTLTELFESNLTENKSRKNEGVADQSVPVYLIGGGELRQLEVGPAFIRWNGAVYSMSEKAFNRFREIVGSRKGTGTSLDQLEGHLDFLITRFR